MLQKTLVLAFLAHVAVSAPAAPPRLGKRGLKPRTFEQPLISGWVADWVPAAPAGMQYQHYDELSFFVALIDDSLSLDWPAASQARYNDDFMAADKLMPKYPDEEKPILLSIGGWTGSKFFSKAVRTKETRKKLADSISTEVVGKKLSGVDLDWEFPGAVTANETHYPGDKGLMCNSVDPADTNNLLAFIKVLRTTLETAMLEDGRTNAPIITAAVPFSGFRNAEDQPLNDASDFVREGALDYISIMAYDMGGPYHPETGPAQPWEVDEKSPWDQQWSMKRSIDYWTKEAKVPADKIQVGLPTYGKKLLTTLPKGTELSKYAEFSSDMYQPQNQPHLMDPTDDRHAGMLKEPFGNRSVGYDVFPVCGIVLDGRELPTYNVSITKQYIANDADGQTPVAAGWTHHWDDKRLSSYLWNAETAEMLTYENPKSFTEKTKKLAAYTDDEERHLLGVKIYHVAGDTDDGVLVNAVRKAWPKK